MVYQSRDGEPMDGAPRLAPRERLHDAWAGRMFPGSNASSGCAATGCTWSGSHASGVPGAAR